MIRKNTKFPKEVMNCVFNMGGLGDNIARLPAIKYLITHHPHIYLNLWVPDYFLEFAKHCLPETERLIIRPFSQNFKYNKKLAAIKSDNDFHTNLATHLVDHAFHVLVDKQVEIEHKNYLQLDLNKIDISKFTLPEKYVIITTGFTAAVREMVPDAVNGLISYVLSKGYTPVFLGSKKAVNGQPGHDIEGKFNLFIDYDKGLDLRDKTSLLEAGKIIAGAKVITGVDNGLLHVAGTTEVPIVAGFTTVKPEHRLPYRHNEMGWNCYSVIPDESLDCRFCQSNWAYLFKHDFRNCYYDDYKCVKMLTADKYIEQLEKIL